MNEKAQQIKTNGARSCAALPRPRHFQFRPEKKKTKQNTHTKQKNSADSIQAPLAESVHILDWCPGKLKERHRKLVCLPRLVLNRYM